MTRRYFASELPTGGGLVGLIGDEAQHAIRVMRVAKGDAITLFDGRGNESEATIVSLGRNQFECNADRSIAVDREPTCEVHLGIAMPKADRARELIERLTELGVASVTPIVAARTQRAPSDSMMEKLRRGVIEACKQCGRNQLLLIHEPVPGQAFFELAAASVRLIAHPMMSSTRLNEINRETSVAIAIGPEGGWTDEEVAMAVNAGFKSVDLGKRIYRIETAAVAIAAVLVS